MCALRTLFLRAHDAGWFSIGIILHSHELIKRKWMQKGGSS